MKKIGLLLSIIMVCSLLVSCDKLKELFGSEDKNDPNTIGGDTNLPVSQVGNTTATSVRVGSTYPNLTTSIKVTANDNGVATYKVTADISKIPSLAKYIPSSMKDASGNLNADIRYKITSEGIQDFFNKDGKPHTIVKYDANVGDQFNLTKSDGVTITRTVTQKSTTDDFPYGLMYIKTSTVEQDSRISGIRKITYRANHKFGLVYVELLMEDGSTASTYLYPANY
jgi:hypothetical protein